MACHGFEKYTLGEWTTDKFNSHIQHCDECLQAVQHDEKVLAMVSSFKKEITAPLLWSRIESELTAASRIRKSDTYRWILRIAALLVLVFGAGVIFFLNRPVPDSGLLAESALKKVERQEQHYERAIRELEKAVTPHLSQLDQELMLLYRDRLETIDTQIEQCKEALAVNPANAHIRRYLLAALQDKKETLKEISKLHLHVSAS